MGAGIIMRAAHYPGRAPIDAYGNGGFRFADMSHRGAILILPSGIHGWNSAGLDATAFDPVVAERAGFDLLLIGTGASHAVLPPALSRMLVESGVRFEVMATGPAVRTYNVLVAEERAVAAALLAVD
ncbi:MAG: MTH938/NDUFAF3 family protein [Rhizobiaceae bacterium]